MNEKFSITWNKDSLADGYIVKSKLGDDFKELVRIENIDITTITAPKFKQGIENHIRVNFYRKKNNTYVTYRYEDYYCFVAPKKFVVYRLPTPKLKDAKKVENSVIIEWEKVADEVMYVVVRKIPGGTWERIGLTKGNTYVDSRIDINSKYIYTVRCVSDDGKTRLSSCSYKGISI